MSESLDWNDLRYFLAIAATGTLAGAARRLGVNHSTVFRRLNALEERLAVRLFDRLPQGYVLTAEGDEVRRHAQQVDDAVNALDRAVAGRDFRLGGSIRVTTPAKIATDYLVHYLPEFAERYPDIQVEVAVGDHDFDLTRREADVALRATANPPEFLVGRPVADLPWYVCASKGFIARHGRPRDMSEVGRFPLIGADESFRRLAVFAWQHRAYPRERIVMRANHLGVMAAMAMQGLGLAFLPVDQYDPELQHLFPVEPQFTGQLWLLTHPDLRQVARVRVFMDFLHGKLRADPRLAHWKVEPRATPRPRAARPARRAARQR